MVYRVLFEMADGPAIVMLRTSNEAQAREKADRLRAQVHRIGGKSTVRIDFEIAR